MLQTQSVDTATLELLKSLQGKAYLKGFYLAGGTGLALYFGHRKSVDLDLFSNFNFNASELLEQISQDFHFKIYHTSTNTLKGSINQINVDIIAHRYPFIANPVTSDNVSLLSVEDILAMKLNAIAVSGQRSKDFIDLYFALPEYSLDSLLQFYKQKYDQGSVGHILKSLVYFEDVDLVDWPVMLRDNNLKWKNVTGKLEKEVRQFITK
jgi:hypothetical protein